MEKRLKLGKAHVTIDGAIWVLAGAKGARITGLTLTSHDPVYSIPLKIQADDFSLVGNDITAARNISCVLIGSDRKVSHTLVELNRIRRCGRTGKLSHLLYVVHTQGAAIARGEWYLTSSSGPWLPGSVYVGAPGSFREHRWATPMGPEDISWWPSTDLLWSVSEHPRRRWIYAMPRSYFDG